ncbi:MAG: DUF6171 family protein [Acetanaerobacterium sp.]
MERSVCRRCMLHELSQDAYFENVYEYIRSLDESIKASPQQYDSRLDICRSCDNLLNGMCKLCGCFVEMRAAVLKNTCAYTPAKW